MSPKKRAEGRSCIHLSVTIKSVYLGRSSILDNEELIAQVGTIFQKERLRGRQLVYFQRVSSDWTNK